MSDSKRAIIVGSEGQDGSILWDRLASTGWAVLGVGRGSVRCTEGWSTGLVDILSEDSVDLAVQEFLPGRIYHLAARHRSAEDRASLSEGAELLKAFSVHAASVEYFFGAMSRHAPKARFFYAASSHVFSAGESATVDERSILAPLDAYGMTKAAGVHLCRRARAAGLHASVGFLFNHESELRKSVFVSQRIVRGAYQIKCGQADRLVLGDLSARVDWGYAPDFVAAIQAISELAIPHEFVVATGVSRTVRDFVRTAFAHLGLDWEKYVRENPIQLNKGHRAMTGDATKLRSMTGWKPTVSFEEMVERLMAAEEKRLAATAS